MYRLLALLLSVLCSSAAHTEIYLGVRPADQLGPGESRGVFVGSWNQVLIDENGTVQSLDKLMAEYGSVFSAVELARANTEQMASNYQIEDAGPVSRILADPLPAVSGLLLVRDFVEDLSSVRNLDSLNMILPMGDLLIFQTTLTPEIDAGFADLATRLAQAPMGLSNLVITYVNNTYTTNEPPTAEEILMSLGTDPENTIVVTLKDGDVVIRMRDDIAPNHVTRIKELAREGFYDGIVFHRVIEGFMAQTGDPTGTGTSGSGQNLNAEFSDAPFLRGTVGMARAASPNSADSQFFIMFADGRFLDNNYTVIGQVESGMEFVDNIKRGEPPVDPDQMIRVQVQADL